MISEYKTQINKVCLRLYPNRADTSLTISISIEYFKGINKLKVFCFLPPLSFNVSTEMFDPDQVGAIFSKR